MKGGGLDVCLSHGQAAYPRREQPGQVRPRLSKLLARRASYRTLATAYKPPAKCWAGVISGL